MSRVLPDYPVLDFSGGVRRDKSDIQKKDNELVRILNFDIDEYGRLVKRLGGQAYGTILVNGSGYTSTDNIFYWEVFTGGSPYKYQLVNNRALAGDSIFKVVGHYLNGAITTSSTSIVLHDSTEFAASGIVEIEGDMISYTGNAANTLTGVTGITSNHPDDAAVHQTVALSGDQPNAYSGIYYAVLNNLLFCQGHSEASTFDGTTLTDVADADYPGGLFATTYRQRIYCADDALGSGYNVYYSDAGDSTSWTSGNEFVVEDSIGSKITGLYVSKLDELLIFKMNSVFAYDEVQLKQRSGMYGAYNHRVTKEIEGMIYSFCPKGVYRTNGYSFEKISQPIDEYLKEFAPGYDFYGRVVQTTCAAVYDGKYCLLVKNLDSLGDVIFIYDPKKNSWTIYQIPTARDVRVIYNVSPFIFATKSIDKHTQVEDGLFLGAWESNKNVFYRMFSKSFNRGTTVYFTGDDGKVFKDFVFDTGSAVNAEAETKFYDLKYPGVVKQFKYLRCLNEQTGFALSYRIEDKNGNKGDWKPLGKTDRVNQRFSFPPATEGYRIAIKIANSSKDIAPTFNGFIFEETILTDKR